MFQEITNTMILATSQPQVLVDIHSFVLSWCSVGLAASHLCQESRRRLLLALQSKASCPWTRVVAFQDLEANGSVGPRASCE